MPAMMTFKNVTATKRNPSQAATIRPQIWYLLLGPFVLRGLQNLLRAKASKYEVQVHETLDILPYLTPVIKHSWQETSKLKGYARIQQFIALSISNCIHFKL